MNKNVKRYVIDTSFLSERCITTMKDGVHCDYSSKTIRELQLEEDNYGLRAVTSEKMDFFLNRYSKALQSPFEKTTEGKFNYLMDCVPPRRFTGNTFFVGECDTVNLYTFCFGLNGEFYRGLRAINTPRNELTKQINDFGRHISFEPEIIKGDKCTDTLCNYSKTPYYFEGRDGKKHLIYELVSDNKNPKNDKKHFHNMTKILSSLRKCNYDYATIYGKHKNMFDLFEWVRSNNYLITISGALLRISPNRDYVDFYGDVKRNVGSDSCLNPFHYRIYDRETLKYVINLLKTVKRKFEWKR